MAASSGKRSLNIATFNILAPCNKRLNIKKGFWYQRESDYPELFVQRTTELLALLSGAMPLDVICLQEYSIDSRMTGLFHSTFGSQYSLLQLPRPDHDEGLAIFVDNSIKIVDSIAQNLTGFSERVALHALLDVPTLNTKVVLSTLHLEFQHSKFSEKIRKGQIQEIIQCTSHMCAKHHLGPQTPVFLAGDFNMTPQSVSYELVTQAGFSSTYPAVNGAEPAVTHKDHHGHQYTADYVFYRNGSCIQPTSCTLYPLEYGAQLWPEEFTTSDHRLMVAQYDVYNSSDESENATVCCGTKCGL